MPTYPLHLPPLIKSFLENTIEERKLLCYITLLANRDCPNNAATVSVPPAPRQYPLQLFASKSGSC